MSQLPANFFARVELQTLAVRASDLAAALVAKTADAGGVVGAEPLVLVQALRDAALALDGHLADRVPTPHPTDRVLANPNGWANAWHHGPAAVPGLDASVGHQTLVTPAGRRFPSGRRKLVVGTPGGETHAHVSTDADHLAGLLARYAAVKE